MTRLARKLRDSPEIEGLPAEDAAAVRQSADDFEHRHDSRLAAALAQHHQAIIEGGEHACACSITPAHACACITTPAPLHMHVHAHR